MEYLDRCKMIFGTFHSHYLFGIVPTLWGINAIIDILQEVFDEH